MSTSRDCEFAFLKYLKEGMRARGTRQPAERLCSVAEADCGQKSVEICALRTRARLLIRRGVIAPLLLFAFIFWGSGNYAFAEAISQKEIDREVAAGRKVSEMIDKDFEIISDPARVVRLSSILQRLTETIEINYPWQVKIIRRDELNAFCLPGGFIYFFEGLINKLRSDSEIASIMAHEIAHIVERHGMKQSARNAKLSIASLILILATGGAAAPIIAAQMAQIAIMNSYSLEYEQEADVKGVKMLISSGYSPSGVVTAMETFMAEEMKTPLYNYGVYMSHPETRKRVEYLAKYLRDNSIPLKRKEALLALRSSILISDDGKAVLMVDDVEIWSGPNNKEVNEVFEETKKGIDRSLQLELAPYEIAVDNGVLRIKNDALAKEPLPEGMAPLDSAREKLLEAVLTAQRKHPMAKYFR